MKSFPALLMQGAPIAALVGAGFTLGTHFLNLPAHARALAARDAGSCVLRNPSYSENVRAAGQVDMTAMIAFLRMCRS